MWYKWDAEVMGITRLESSCKSRKLNLVAASLLYSRQAQRHCLVPLLPCVWLSSHLPCAENENGAGRQAQVGRQVNGMACESGLIDKKKRSWISTTARLPARLVPFRITVAITLTTTAAEIAHKERGVTSGCSLSAASHHPLYPACPRAVNLRAALWGGSRNVGVLHRDCMALSPSM